MNKEVDIVYIAAKMISFTRRYILIIGAATLIGAGYGFYKSSSSQVQYVSNFSIENSDKSVNSFVIQELFNNLKASINQNNLDLTEQDISNLAERLSAVKSVRIVSNIPGIIKFNLVLSSSEVDVIDIQKAILTYISNNHYIKKITANKKRELESQLDKIKLEMNELDQYQELILENIENGLSNQANLPDYKSNIYNQRLLMELSNQLSEVNSFSVINSAPTPSKAVRSGTATIVIMTISFFLLGFLISSVFALFSEIKKRELD